MVIETAISLAAACVKALKFAAGLKSTSAQVKAKCESLAGRVNVHHQILRGPGLAAAARADKGTAAALRRLEAALRAATRAADSCGQSGGIALVVALVAGSDLPRLVAAEEEIERCIRDLQHAAAAAARSLKGPAAPVEKQPVVNIVANNVMNFFNQGPRPAVTDVSSSSNAPAFSAQLLQDLGPPRAATHFGRSLAKVFSGNPLGASSVLTTAAKSLMSEATLLTGSWTTTNTSDQLGGSRTATTEISLPETSALAGEKASDKEYKKPPTTKKSLR